MCTYTNEPPKPNQLEASSIGATQASSRLFPASSSSSCPHLTADEEHGKMGRLRHDNSSTKTNDSNESILGFPNQGASPAPLSVAGSSETPSRRFFDPSRVTKTYSFKRMMSFRTSRRSNGTSTGGGVSEIPQGNHHYLPLQFSFLGQIYRKTTVRRTSSSNNTNGTTRAKFSIEPPSSPSHFQDEK
eukprot:TCALIF_02015-PA protein Name:"Protein of unknown function" AED:0.42 eAED:0.42 QI:0/0/0/0.5/0/0.5/2/0/186